MEVILCRLEEPLAGCSLTQKLTLILNRQDAFIVQTIYRQSI